MMFNQTTNPFLKKNNISNIVGQNHSSYYITQQQEHIANNEPVHKNMLEMSKSYLKVLEENKKLRSRSVSVDKNNDSRDIENLLESLHESEEEERKMREMQETIEQLKGEVSKLTEMNGKLRV